VFYVSDDMLSLFAFHEIADNRSGQERIFAGILK
jgi:hypothetical protein